VSSAARRAIKRSLDACCLPIVGPAVAMCRLEARLSERADAMFTFWAQTFALVPGLPGVFVRRAFYRRTLESCGDTFFIGFGAVFTHRLATIEDDVYVGPYAIIGAAALRHGCLIGSRCSIPSGGALHALDANLRWMPTDMTRLRRVEIGAHAWLGEASVVLADIGASTMVAAGSVVTTAVPAAIMVAGNPSRFVRRLSAVTSDKEVHPVASAV
jgi:virginiamycin A acetyltransferase